jgi:hypothetical protein
VYFAGTVEVTVMATFVRVGDKTKAIIRKQGFPTKAKTFLRLTDAKKWAKRLEAQIESGSETWDVLKNEQKKFTHKFIQSWRVWSSN